MLGEPPVHTCAICGLRVTVIAGDHGVATTYAMGEWQQRCRSAHLETPSLCPGFLRQIAPVLSAYRPTEHADTRQQGAP